MKKIIIKSVIAIISMVAFVGCFAQVENIGLQAVLTLGSAATLCLCAKAYEKVEK